MNFTRLLPLASLVFLGPTLAAAADTVEFNRDIRPILSNNCYHCHGPDNKQRKADLRLDEEDGIQTAFEPGDVDSSEAWLRIHSKDPKRQMPPPGSHKELTADEIALLGKWIEQGAKWDGHWSFIAPTRPNAPKVKNKSWIQENPIDAFVLAQLEKEQLEPSPEAARELLLRRVSMDLTGLPPTVAEIDAFLGDSSPDAYEKVVDRLLASPHYGERMAVAWMDAARYGDSSVFHADGPRDMWPWRDWVIRAYNGNKPFDEFTVEQLAGDLIPGATLQQKIATGFNRNNASTDEGGVIAEEFRVEYAVDRVKTTATVWMGLTMECGQCHDHKYDPIPQADYYRFFAYFNQASDPGMQSRKGNQTPTVGVPDLAHFEKVKQIEAQLVDLRQQRQQREDALGADYQAWLSEFASTRKATSLPGDAILHLALDESEGKTAADAIDSSRKGILKGAASWTEGRHAGAFQVNGKNYLDLGDAADFERTDTFSYGAWIKPNGKGSGAPIARMNDGNKYRGYDLYVSNGRVSVHIINTWPENAIKVTTNASLKPNQWQHVFATYDGSSKASGIKIYFDGKEQPWTIEQDGLSGTIRTTSPLFLGRRNPGSPFNGAIDDVRFYHRSLDATEVAALAGSDPLAEILATKADQRTDAQRTTLKRHFLRNHDPAYKTLNEEITSLGSQITAGTKPVSTVMVMQDVGKPRMTYILNRGAYDSPNKDQPVEPGTLSALPASAEDAPANRLGMAQWLVQPNHPLTARVTVNRYWYMLFGTGIVKTVEDFGSQGEWPSHPALLDWLAVDFRESGWDVKRMIRQLVTSATYRQNSRVTAERYERDPANRLLARGPRFRLAGEFIRDNALAASGLLSATIGGPSVKPYQPGGLWNEVSLGGNVRFVQDKGDKLYRRSLYTYWKRSATAPSLTIFDVPTRDKCMVQRPRTNTPLQALVTLNDIQFVEAARALAERSILDRGGQEPKEHIVYAYRTTTGQQPRAATLAILVEAYEEELATFKAEPERAKQLLSIGESARDTTIDAAQHAAMTIVTSMILNLDETLTRG